MSGWTPEPEGTPLAGTEMLARAVVSSRWYNKATGALRAEVFEPPPGGQLSVTRHVACDGAILWERCRAVAIARKRDFYGRADISAAAAMASGDGILAVAAAREHDPGHAHITGWPPDGSQHVSIMQAMAAAATFVPAPPTTAG